MAFLIFASFSIHAQDVTMSYGKNNELILTGNSCDELIAESQAICSWKEQIEVGPSSQEGQCQLKTNRQYSLKIDSCLPHFVKKYQRKKLLHSGANCWGTAMSFKKLSSVPRFVWPEEMEYWMDSPLCRKLDINETLQEGDIINVYGPEYVFENASPNDKGIKFWQALFPNRYLPTKNGQIGYSGYHHFLHSETYVSKNLSFGKDSPAHDDRFEFHHLNEVYGRSRETLCQENQALSPYRREYQNPPKPIKGSTCDYFTIAYRCGDLETFFKSQNLDEESQKILNEISLLKKKQERLFLLMINPMKLGQAEINQTLQDADKVSKEALNALKTPTSKIKEMLLTLKYFSAEALRKSLEQARLTPATEPL